MGADSSGSQDSKDPNHIWLRQSVTFTVNGQTRTVEMALPLRPGATPGEVEALLDEADAGMRRLSRRLDAHLATLTNHASDDERQPITASAAPAAPATPARAATPPPSPAPMSTPMSAPMSAEPAADLSIRDFVAAITALGYTQRQVMEKLNVRSLAGLNLRESLEALHRQALLEGAPSAQSSAPASAPPSHPAPPLAFEEEDGEEALSGEPEMELSYPDPASRPDEDEDEDEQPPAPAPTLDALKRDARLTPAAKLPPAQRRPSPPPAAPATPEPEVEEPLAARAQRLLTELRALRGGGEASDHQRAALANIVVSELTERGVAALAKDVWNITPDEMGPEQYDALISWGKRDHFKDEAREVIKAARAAGPPPPMVATPPDEPESELEDAPDEPPPPPARGGRGSRARGSASDAPRSDA